MTPDAILNEKLAMIWLYSPTVPAFVADTFNMKLSVLAAPYDVCWIA